MRTDRDTWMRAWAPVVLWVALIFWLSSDAFSASATSGILGPLLEWLLPSASADTIYRLHVLVRKCAHLGVYAGLALLALRALRRAPGLGWGAGVLASLLVVGVVASADEVRQGLSEERSGSLRDVGIDVAGGAGALGLALTALAVRAARRARPVEGA